MIDGGHQQWPQRRGAGGGEGRDSPDFPGEKAFHLGRAGGGGGEKGVRRA